LSANSPLYCIVLITKTHKLTNLTPSQPVDLARSTVEHLNSRRPVTNAHTQKH